MIGPVAVGAGAPIKLERGRLRERDHDFRTGDEALGAEPSVVEPGKFGL